jgi:hypothetical protein
MYETLITSVKAHIDEIKENERTVYMKGWTFCEINGVCPIRLKYDNIIKSIDNLIRLDICNKFEKTELMFCGWDIEIPFDKFIDLQIQINSEWKTFSSINTVKKADSKTDGVSELDFCFNNNVLSNIFIIDNFYLNPNDVRLHGLMTFTNTNLPNFAQNVPYYKERFEQIMNIKLAPFNKYIENGTFQCDTAGNTLIFNTQKHQYGGMIFLTPNAPVNTGITLYRSKHTKQMTVSSDETKMVFKNGHKDSTEFEPVDVIGNVFNRLVIFNTKFIHAFSHNFGNNLNNGRLVQFFAFDIAPDQKNLS